MASNAQFRRTSALVGGLAPLLLGIAMPAYAQTAPAAAPAPAPAPDAADKDDNAIIVTGTLFHRVDKETASPVTTLTTDDFQKRGIQTVQAAIQTLSSNNGPALTNSFTANGAFAGGASAVSLRGLTTDSTLVLFDGLRAAYYPLADDGVRNFVDLNTIPDEIVDRVEVVEDGASSTYGADAVAGVVNIITKKQIVGFHGTAEAGESGRGTSGNQRLSATYGYGDLSDQGYNFYISGHYIHSSALYNRDARSPFNSDDQTGICHNGTCGPNLIANGVDPALLAATGSGYTGTSTAVNAFSIRPYDPTNTTALGRYQLVSNCGGLPSYNLTDADLAEPANASAAKTVCQQDITKDYGQIEPKQERYGGSARATARIGDNSEAYVELNYERSYSAYTGLGSIIRGNAPAGIDFPAYSTSANGVYGTTVLTLPAYICPRGTTVACTAANGTPNPNLASLIAAGYPEGTVGRLIGRLPTSTEFNSSLSQVYRAAAGIHGSFGDNWNYQIDGTAMVSKLRTQAKGYVYIQHLLDEIADGSYNFVNPSATSQADLDYLTPTQTNHQSSHLYQGQAVLSKSLFQLPGGAVQFAVGGQVRYESLNDPSGNPDANGPTERYFRLNAFGASGHRTVASGYFELTAPIIKQIEIDASGRYDHYSTGQSNFSPKIGVKIKPIQQILLRGTFSKGFRIPSFAESGALPTTGYVTVSPASLLLNSPDFYNQHLNGAGGPDNYLTAYSIGETTVGNPKLKAEKSQNFTLGALIEPIRNVSFKASYYNIKKTNAITSVDFQGAINNYYATGQTSFDGVTIVQDEVDQQHPDAQRRVAFAQGSFINANKISTSGIDFGVTASYPLSDKVKFITSGNATYIIKLNTKFPDGHTEHYAGTLGNFNLTAGSGTQKWKANWSNTLDFGKGSITATAYYTSGYNYSAEDQGSVAGDCSLVPSNEVGDAFQGCNVKAAIFFDLHGEIKVGDKFTFYTDVLNVADKRPPLDATTYGAYLYNPVVGDEGIIGRSFRVGAKVDL